jgi:hypothetical protein
LENGCVESGLEFSDLLDRNQRDGGIWSGGASLLDSMSWRTDLSGLGRAAGSPSQYCKRCKRRERLEQLTRLDVVENGSIGLELEAASPSQRLRWRNVDTPRRILGDDDVGENNTFRPDSTYLILECALTGEAV